MTRMEEDMEIVSVWMSCCAAGMPKPCQGRAHPPGLPPSSGDVPRSKVQEFMTSKTAALLCLTKGPSNTKYTQIQEKNSHSHITKCIACGKKCSHTPFPYKRSVHKATALWIVSLVHRSSWSQDAADCRSPSQENGGRFCQLSPFALNDDDDGHGWALIKSNPLQLCPTTHMWAGDDRCMP